MKRIVLFLILLSPVLCWSQAELRIESVQFVTVPVITPTITEVTLVNTTVKNYAPDWDFDGVLHIHIAVLDTLNQPQPMDDIDKGFYHIDSLGGTGDSIVIDSVHVNVIQSYFHDGNNTVVIWPAAIDNYTVDTFQVVILYNSISELIKENINVTMGPNPANERLYLGDPENLVRQVRIRSLDGKLLGTAQTNTFLQLSGFSNGMYLVELETADRIYTRKLIIRK